MPKSRTPIDKAHATGQTLNHPGRFKKRNEPKVTKPIGAAPKWMNADQRAAWDSFKNECFWLNYSHRAILEIASTIRARVHSGEDVGVGALNLLRLCLAQLALTPVDASKISIPDDKEPDPADKYFNR